MASASPSDADYEALSAEFAVLAACMSGCADFILRHELPDKKTAAVARKSPQFNQFTSCMDELKSTLCLGLHPTAVSDPRVDAIISDKAAGARQVHGSEAESYLEEVAKTFCLLLDSCVKWAQLPRWSDGTVEAVRRLAHHAFVKARASFLAYGLPNIADSMKLVWADEFRHYVYGFSLSTWGEDAVPTRHMLVKIGYTKSELEYLAAFHSDCAIRSGQQETPLVPGRLKDYASFIAEQKKMVDGKMMSRIISAASQYWDWKADDDNNRVLFLFGPFPTKSAAVHAEHLIRMLSGNAADPSLCTPLDKSNGEGDFVAVPFHRLDQLESLTEECADSRASLMDSHKLTRRLAQLITLD